MISREWAAFAKEDFVTVISLWEQNLPLYRVICFHSQQYAE